MTTATSEYLNQPMRTLYQARVHRAYYAFLAADKAWSTLLREQFGKSACNVRYTRAGRGVEGSDLNRAYQAFTDARNSWVAAVSEK